MLLRKLLLCALIPLGALTGPAMAAVNFNIEIGAPPPPRVHVVPAPRPGYFWSPGYWASHGHRHVWVQGHWMRAQPGYQWVPERWEQRGHRHHFHRGYWERAHDRREYRREDWEDRREHWEDRRERWEERRHQRDYGDDRREPRYEGPGGHGNDHRQYR